VLANQAGERFGRATEILPKKKASELPLVTGYSEASILAARAHEALLVFRDRKTSRIPTEKE
jgi:hypothetical protein